MPRRLPSFAVRPVLRRALALVAVLAAPAAAGAQSSPTDLLPDDDPRRAAALAVVTALFDGMRAADSARIRAVFHPDARIELLSAGRGPEGPVVRRTPLDAFVRAIASRPGGVDEKTYDERVFMDGSLAVVWTGYDVFVGDRFLHCGVDAFTLAETADGWRILALADTRRQTGCRHPNG